MFSICSNVVAELMQFMSHPRKYADRLHQKGVKGSYILLLCTFISNIPAMVNTPYLRISY